MSQLDGSSGADWTAHRVGPMQQPIGSARALTFTVHEYGCSYTLKYLTNVTAAGVKHYDGLKMCTIINDYFLC